MLSDPTRTSRHWPVTLGILGGGQLALMLSHAACRLGIRVRVLDPEASCPAKVAAEHVRGSWSDAETLADFAAQADVITVENEFVEAQKLAALERRGHMVLPSSETMRLVQDKLVQKQMLRDADVPVADFMQVAGQHELEDALTAFGFPLVLKKRTLGYDGTGNFTVSSPADAQSGVQKLGGFEAGLYAERWCPFTKELAVIVTRDRWGRTAMYPVVETRQHEHVCSSVVVPPRITSEQTSAALQMAARAVEAVAGVGSFGIELFLMPDGSILLNEMSPRVHNSGHYTLEACDCSQFENHVRAVCDLPLGSTRLRSAAAMVNLLAKSQGSGHPSGMTEALAIPGASVHLYGKLRASPGRKMGHVTALGEDADSALQTAQLAAEQISFRA
jgi:phosphoribosylaminoimidazole carboxylase PurK protein